MLSPSQYALIEPYFKANVALDSGLQPSWIRALDVACQNVSARDSLLASFRLLCHEQVATDEIEEEEQQCPDSAGIVNAESAGQILKADRLISSCQADDWDALAAANTVLVARSRHFNQVVDRSVSAKLCRQVLDTSPADLAYYPKVSVAIRRRASATRRGASIPMEHATAAWEQLNNDTPFQSNQVQLTELERNCE